jgi:hypothetical protein
MPTFNKDVSTIRNSPCRSKRVFDTNKNIQRRAAVETDYAVLIGLDWSSLKHDLCVLDVSGQIKTVNERALQNQQSTQGI